MSHSKDGSTSSKFPAASITRTRSSSETGSVNPFSSTTSDHNSTDPAPFLSDNASSYSSHTLRTLANGGGTDSESEDHDPSTIRVNHHNGSSAAAEDPSSPASILSKEAAQERRRVIVRAFAQLAILFVVCTLIIAGTLYIALPDIDEEDKAAFRIPKNFDQLKALNNVLQRYKDENFGRVMLCWIVVYMFLQAFSIPGSMYMSILAGAMWGVPLALPIVCASVATGATICYLISMLLGSVLIAIPSWQARVDSWKVVIERQQNDLLSYMIVIRMMPLPPHNVVNILAPHLGIKLPLFWISTFFGIFAVSVIHTTIGEKLDQMTSPADFQLFTLRNALLLGGVCIAVMIPVLVRKRSSFAGDPLENQEGQVRLDGSEGTLPSSNRENSRSRLLGRSRSDDSDDDELPPVRMRGAISGLSHSRQEDQPLSAEEEERSNRSSLDDNDSFRGFEDRTPYHKNNDDKKNGLLNNLWGKVSRNNSSSSSNNGVSHHYNSTSR
ncbi:unnamed protein product [Sympodiomycopsis kandeliae]